MIDRRTAVAALLGASIAAAAALGIPHDGMLQDTFKSAVICIGVLVGALALVWPGTGEATLRWHPVLLLPLLLAGYALGSIAWSHPWQAGVEAVRWLVIAMVGALAVQVLHEEKGRAIVAWCVAGGAVGASVWTILQFCFALDLFPQGARPGSTFVNRNFFAEFAVCGLPYLAYLILRERRRAGVAVLSVGAGVVIVAVCMTGSRAALVALGAIALFAVAKTLGSGLRRDDRRVIWACMLVTVALLGFIPTGDSRIAAENRGDTAITRAFTRTAAIASGDEATTMRFDMWRATAKTISRNPLSGIGAGAWENDADYYAHNEFLQVVAEYGVVGWMFLLGLAAWLLRMARKRRDTWHGTALASLAALFIVSFAGFPWHLAATGAMLAIGIGALAAEDAREVRLGRAASIVCAGLIAMALALAAYVTWTAAQAESRLSRAVRIALAIGATANPNDARWAPSKSEMLRLVDEGMRLHPNERQMTPIVADELGRWGDWPNAIRIWEHVLRSHPDVAAIQANVARGYIAIGRPDLAAPHVERARQLRQMSASKG